MPPGAGKEGDSMAITATFINRIVNLSDVIIDTDLEMTDDYTGDQRHIYVREVIPPDV
jgi:hypothetical protein